MKETVQFRNKTRNKSAQNIKKTESSLKRNVSQGQYHAIQTEINSNEDSTRKDLQQRKFKKYNNLKYRPKSTNQTRVQEEQEDFPNDKNEKTLYSDILKRKRSKTDIERKKNIDNNPTLNNNRTTKGTEHQKKRGKTTITI